MENQHTTFAQPRLLMLSQGDQAVINGALVTANGDCSLEVASGAFVATGRSTFRAPFRNPREELYLSLLDSAASAEPFAAQRFRLFAVLTQVALQECDAEEQAQCTRCAAALMAEDMKEATRIAAELASAHIETPHTPRHSGAFEPETKCRAERQSPAHLA